MAHTVLQPAGARDRERGPEAHGEAFAGGGEERTREREGGREDDEL